MQRYELATLTALTGAAGKCAPGIAAFCAEGGGTLLGILQTEIGALNRILVLRGFADEAALRTERARTQSSSNPFGCAVHLAGMELDAYAPLDFVPPVQTGALGPFYEIRTYVTRPNGLGPTIEAWREALPGRLAFSKPVIVMHTLDGPTRLTHIWPYPSLNDRAAIRAASVAAGNWPPKGGPDWLSPDMRSWICTPMPGSPLS
jgi:hypothetical protein